jgi:hypothetical protein
MAGDDIAFLSAGELTGFYAAGKLSPVEATQPQKHLQRKQ